MGKFSFCCSFQFPRQRKSVYLYWCRHSFYGLSTAKLADHREKEKANKKKDKVKNCNILDERPLIFFFAASIIFLENVINDL